MMLPLVLLHTHTHTHGLTRTHTDIHGLTRTHTHTHGLTRTHTDTPPRMFQAVSLLQMAEVPMGPDECRSTFHAANAPDVAQQCTGGATVVSAELTGETAASFARAALRDWLVCLLLPACACGWTWVGVLCARMGTSECHVPHATCVSVFVRWGSGISHVFFSDESESPAQVILAHFRHTDTHTDTHADTHTHTHTHTQTQCNAMCTCQSCTVFHLWALSLLLCHVKCHCS